MRKRKYYPRALLARIIDHFCCLLQFDIPFYMQPQDFFQKRSSLQQEQIKSYQSVGKCIKKLFLSVSSNWQMQKVFKSFSFAKKLNKPKNTYC